MEKKTDHLSQASVDEAYVDLGQDLSERANMDLSGEHEAEIISFQSRTSAKGDTYHNVGALLLSDEGQGEKVYGAVFLNQSLERFVRALGLDPAKVGSKLSKDQVIGKPVLVEVVGEEQKRDGKAPEKVWTIKRFAPPPDDGQR